MKSNFLKRTLIGFIALSAVSAWALGPIVDRGYGAELGDPGDPVERPGRGEAAIFPKPAGFDFLPRYEGGELGNPRMVPYQSPTLELVIRHPETWGAPYEDDLSALLVVSPDVKPGTPEETFPKVVLKGERVNGGTDAALRATLFGLNNVCSWKKTYIAGRRAYFCRRDGGGLAAVLRDSQNLLVIEFSYPDGRQYDRTIKPMLSSIEFLEDSTPLE